MGGPSIKWGQLSADRMLALAILDSARMGDIITRVSCDASAMADAGMEHRHVVQWLDSTLAAYEDGARAQMKMDPRPTTSSLHPFGQLPNTNVFGTVPVDILHAAPAANSSPPPRGRAPQVSHASPPWAAQQPAHRVESAAATIGGGGTSPTRDNPPHHQATSQPPSTPRLRSLPPPHTVFFPINPDGFPNTDVAVLAGEEDRVPYLAAHLTMVLGRGSEHDGASPSAASPQQHAASIIDSIYTLLAEFRGGMHRADCRALLYEFQKPVCAATQHLVYYYLTYYHHQHYTYCRSLTNQ